MPAKGSKKDPVTGKWTKPPSKITVVKARKPKDELGPVLKPGKDDKEYATVIITYRDTKGKLRTTTYIMAEMSLNESLNEMFEGAKKKARIHLNIDGVVADKT